MADLEDDENDDSGREFTAAERREMRRNLEQDRRVRWFWSSIRVWVGYGTATAAAAYGLYQALRDSGVVKKLGGP